MLRGGLLRSALTVSGREARSVWPRSRFVKAPWGSGRSQLGLQTQPGCWRRRNCLVSDTQSAPHPLRALTTSPSGLVLGPESLVRFLTQVFTSRCKVEFRMAWKGEEEDTKAKTGLSWVSESTVARLNRLALSSCPWKALTLTPLTSTWVSRQVPSFLLPQSPGVSSAPSLLLAWLPAWNIWSGLASFPLPPGSLPLISVIPSLVPQWCTLRAPSAALTPSCGYCPVECLFHVCLPESRASRLVLAAQHMVVS